MATSGLRVPEDSMLNSNFNLSESSSQLYIPHKCPTCGLLHPDCSKEVVWGKQASTLLDNIAIADDLDTQQILLDQYQSKLDFCCRRFAWFYNPKNRNERVLIPLPCNDRFCVKCAKSRANRARQLLEALMMERGLFSRPNSLKLIVLTVENFPADKLPWGLRCFRRWFKRLKSRKIWKDNVRGYFEAFEITKDDFGRWHLHLHLLAEAKFVDVYQLSQEWREVVLKEWNGYIVDIRALRNPRKALREVTKYCFKPSSLSLEDRAFLSSLLKKQRLYGFGGDWSKDFKGVPYNFLLYKNPVIQEIKKRWVFIGIVKLNELNMDEWVYDDNVGIYRGLIVEDSS